MEYEVDTDRLKQYLRIAEQVVNDEKPIGGAASHPHLVSGIIQALALERLSITFEADLMLAQTDTIRVLEDIRTLLSNRGE